MHGFKSYKLEELYNISSGLSKSRNEFGFGHPFVTFKDVFYNYFLPQKLGSLVNTSEKEIQSCSVKIGDIFLTRTSETADELGMSSVALKDYPKATFNGFTKRLRLKENLQVEIDPVFIGYYFRSSFIRTQLGMHSSMSTRASLNNDAINSIEIKIPDIHAQVKIGAILKCLDDKIELNRRMNQTLEQMAQALFNHYFVDNIDPDNLPRGWSFGKLGEVLSFRNGKSSPTRNDNYPFPVYGSNGIIGYCDLANCEANSFIIGRVGSFCGSLYLTLEQAYVTDNAIIAIPRIADSSTFCYQLLQSLNLNNFRGGSGQPLVNQSVLSNIDIIIPPVDLIKKYEKIAFNFYRKRFQNEKENKTLSSLRDTLLPKLMSGEIDVDALMKEQTFSETQSPINLQTA